MPPAAVVAGLGTADPPRAGCWRSAVFVAGRWSPWSASPGWPATGGRVRRCGGRWWPPRWPCRWPYQLVPHGLLRPAGAHRPALAKAAGSSWWSQGATYLWNFVAPYTLWLPLALAVPLVGDRVARWWRIG